MASVIPQVPTVDQVMSNAAEPAVSVPIAKPTQDVVASHDTEKDKDKNGDRKKMNL